MLFRSVADDRNSLVLQIKRPVPPRRMHGFSLEKIKAIDARISGHIKLTHCGHKKVTCDGVGRGIFGLLLTGGANNGRPLFRRLIPGSLFHSRIETNMLIEAPCMSYPDQIRQDLLLCWVFSSPRRVWIKGIRIQMTPYYSKLETHNP